MMLPAFNWIITHRLAGSGRPGLLADLDEDVEFLRTEGIRTIATLTEQPVVGLVERDEFDHLHFPIPDMGFPTPRSCAALCQQVLARMERGAVLLHCRAGLGRTGMVAACCLVAMGEPAARALQRVRNINRLYVQTRSQEQFIEHFARHLAQTQPTDDS